MPALLWRHNTDVAGPDLVPEMVDYFGLAFLRGTTVFTLLDLVNELGMDVFDGGLGPSIDSTRLPHPQRPDHLPVPNYYDDPANDDYPAVSHR